MSWYTPEEAMAKWPTLTVENCPGAWIGDDCTFGAGCFIGGHDSYWRDPDHNDYTGPVVIGVGNVFEDDCCVYNGTTIGDGNHFGKACEFWGSPTIGDRNVAENCGHLGHVYSGTSDCFFWNGCTVGNDNQFGAECYIGVSTIGTQYDEVWGSSYVGNRNVIGPGQCVWFSSSIADDCVIGGDVLTADPMTENCEFTDSTHVGSNWTIGKNVYLTTSLIGPNRVNVIPNPRAHEGTALFNATTGLLERITNPPVALPAGADACFRVGPDDYVWMNIDPARIPGETISWQVKVYVSGVTDEDAHLVIGFEWHDYNYTMLQGGDGWTPVINDWYTGSAYTGPESEERLLPLEAFELFSGSVRIPERAALFNMTVTVDNKPGNLTETYLYTTQWMVEAGDTPGDYADGDTIVPVNPPDVPARSRWEWLGRPRTFGGVGDYYWNPAHHASTSYHVCDYSPRMQRVFPGLYPDTIYDSQLQKQVSIGGSVPDEVRGVLAVIDGATETAVARYEGVLPLNNYTDMETLFNQLIEDTDYVDWNRYYYFGIGFEATSWEENGKWYYLDDSVTPDAEWDPDGLYTLDWYYFDIIDGRTTVGTDATYSLEQHGMVWTLFFPNLKSVAVYSVTPAESYSIVRTRTPHRYEVGDVVNFDTYYVDTPLKDASFTVVAIIDNYDFTIDTVVPALSFSYYEAFFVYLASPQSAGHELTLPRSIIPSSLTVTHTLSGEGVSLSGSTSLDMHSWRDVNPDYFVNSHTHHGAVSATVGTRLQRGTYALEVDFPAWSMGDKVKIGWDAQQYSYDVTIEEPPASNRNSWTGVDELFSGIYVLSHDCGVLATPADCGTDRATGQWQGYPTGAFVSYSGTTEYCPLDPILQLTFSYHSEFVSNFSWVSFWWSNGEGLSDYKSFGVTLGDGSGTLTFNTFWGGGGTYPDYIPNEIYWEVGFHGCESYIFPSPDPPHILTFSNIVISKV
jgi:serine acetyltransferase